MKQILGPGGRQVKRGDVYYADLPDFEEGSIQSGRRPVLVTQNDRLNRNSTTVIVAMITSKIKRIGDETHVVLPMLEGLPAQSMVVAEQRKTIAKKQLVEYRCTLSDELMREVTKALHESEKSGEQNYRKKKKRKTVHADRLMQAQKKK